MQRVTFIAVVGGSGSGKTWLAERLADRLGTATTRLRLDDFYRDLSHLTRAGRDACNFDDPAAIDWEAVREAVEELAAGRAARAPVYDFASHSRRPGTQSLPPAPVVIGDGLWLLHPGWLRGRFAFSVFVDCAMEVRLERRIGRDSRERGRNEGSVRRQFETQVEPMHRRFVEPQRAFATRCVSSPVEEPALVGLLEALRAVI